MAQEFSFVLPTNIASKSINDFLLDVDELKFASATLIKSSVRVEESGLKFITLSRFANFMGVYIYQYNRLG